MQRIFRSKMPRLEFTMKMKDISRVTAVAFAIILSGLIATAPAKADTPIRDFIFDINTKDDEKDRGESVRFQIIKKDTEILYDSGWIHGDLVFGKGAWDSRRGAPQVPFTLEDAPSLKLRVEKQGDQRWEVSFRVRANGDSLLLMDDTLKVVFGKRNTTNIDKPLRGADGKAVTHLDGGSIHIFAFAPKP